MKKKQTPVRNNFTLLRRAVVQTPNQTRNPKPYQRCELTALVMYNVVGAVSTMRFLQKSTQKLPDWGDGTVVQTPSPNARMTASLRFLCSGCGGSHLQESKLLSYDFSREKLTQKQVEICQVDCSHTAQACELWCSVLVSDAAKVRICLNVQFKQFHRTISFWFLPATFQYNYSLILEQMDQGARMNLRALLPCLSLFCESILFYPKALFLK